MDVESKPSASDSGGRNPSRTRCICLSVAAAILCLGLIFLILGLTVFKVKKPRTTVESVSLRDLDISLDLTRLRVLLNVSLDLGVSVTNPNSVDYSYTNSTVLLRYRGTDVGDAPVPAGSIAARGVRSLNLTLTLMADRFLSDATLFSDATSGKLLFQTYLRLSGKARVLFFSVHVVTYSTCDILVILSNRTVVNQECNYKTEL